MQVDRGEPADGVPAAVGRRAQRLLRILDAADEVRTLRAVPAIGEAAEEGSCRVALGDEWVLTFIWRLDGAWNVALEEA